MSTIPSWTDSGIEVIAPKAMARASLPKRGTLDLTNKFGAYLFLGVGRGGTTALTNGVNVEVRRTMNAGGMLLPPAPHFAAVTGTAAAVLKQINNPGGYPAGTQQFTIDGADSPAADDDICFWGVTSLPSDNTPLPNLEFARVAKFSSPTLSIDAPCQEIKLDDELITTKAECWCVWCPGGCIYEVIFDYMDDAAGESVAIAAWAQIFDSLTKG